MRDLGITRLSFGVQSFDEKELEYLGRIHSVKDFERIYQEARASGFNNINLDLIYGLSDQTLGNWERTLRKAVGFKPEHISLYPLTIEAGTPFSGSGIKVNADVQADMYEFSMELLKKAGYLHYEISNWAKKGFECRHNLNYWHCGQYIGIGASAASYLNGERYKNTEDLKKYMAFADNPREIAEEKEEITFEKKLSEEIILNLRCSRGVRISQEIIKKYGSVLNDLTRESLLAQNDGYFCLTNKGKLLANQVMMRFL